MNRLENISRLLINQSMLDSHVNKQLQAIREKSSALFIHSNNVAFIAAQIALSLKLELSDVSAIVTGGLLHDIGKIVITDAILNKPEKLTEAEFNIIRKHPEFGYQIIHEYPYSNTVKDIVLHHHETENASGYPHASTDMRLETKIVAIADKCVAIMEERPYHLTRNSFNTTMRKMDIFRYSFTDVDQIYYALHRCTYSSLESLC